MSIAVTARLRPCSLFLGGMAIICCAVVFLGISYVLSYSGHALPGFLRIVLGCAVTTSGLYGLARLRRFRQVVWVQLCAAGTLRLAVEDSTEPCTIFPSIKAQTGYLLPNSTLLPYVMLWQVRCESGHSVSVPIMPGTVSPATFRSLSLASRQIVDHQPFG